MTVRQLTPTATYRLQFHREFTFEQATAILDYLKALGISHVYSSPFFHAGATSTHGYDVADHNRINPALGGEAGFRAFAAALKERDLGQVLDFVPNHMGISEPINCWWMDVLENGPASEFSDYFDIEWHPHKEELENKVLLPILGDRYGRILESGEFKLAHENGAFFLRYHEAKLPLNPRSYPLILSRVIKRMDGDADRECRDELESVSASLHSLPLRSSVTPELIKYRAREKEVAKRRLARLSADFAVLREAIDAVLRELEGEVGNPATFDALDELLNAQVYRLAYWRVAAEEINYRRFFDINTLAAIRTEVPEVFAASHELVFKMIQDGDVTGLRIDHIDGLWDPRTYLEKLRESFPNTPFYLVVEKILGTDEWLPRTWPVQGTTGYEFIRDVSSVLVDTAAEKALTDLYAQFADETDFEDLVHEKKLFVTRMTMGSEMAALGRMANRLSEASRHTRDFTLGQLTAAIRETMACFPIYRTYVSRGEPVRDEDRLVILRTIRKARRRNPSIDKPVFDFIARMLLMEGLDQLPPRDREEQVKFALKFQQVSGPVMAKSVEDTVFYIYHRLIALNEVGGEPGRFGGTVKEFHERCSERLTRCPRTMLASSTHDTKRSEDVRARLLAISELADEWRKLVGKWVDANAALKIEVEGRHAPAPNEEYLLYQTLAGAWPLELLDDASRPSFVSRIQDYMMKALKEAKINSSWIEPHEEWETATREFVAAILDPERGRKFLKTFEPFAQRIAELGMVNSLSQVLLKCTTPGMPDLYQGCEIWDFSLVDPDNRRPVDYEKRKALLATLERTNAKELRETWRSGAIKLFITQRLLQLRQTERELFDLGKYQPIAASGAYADRAVSFLREGGGRTLAVFAPRLTAKIGFPPIGKAWKDTTVELPPGRWLNVFTNSEIEVAGPLRVADWLSEFPVGCLIRR